MNFISYKNKNFYKGNLHSHSTVSDGTYTPEELKEIYKREGYSFIAYSDHNIFKNLSHLNDDEFLAYFSSEIKSYGSDNSEGCGDYRTYHLNCLKHYNNDSYEEFTIEPIRNKKENHYENTQKLIDDMKARGFLVTINHPIWSRMKPEDLTSVNGYFALEIYNSNCAIDGDDDGNGTLLWDMLLRDGKKVFGFAADDNHNKYDVMVGNSAKIDSTHKRWPSCKGWVMVSADELSDKAIAKALEQGEFYSSTGPEIYEFNLTDGIINVKCSDCIRINVISYDYRGFSYYDEDGTGLQEINHKLSGFEKYIRVECIDKNGKKAWTNPIFLK